MSNFEFRIAKPGTRPKGGSPKDNFGLFFLNSAIRNPQSAMLSLTEPPPPSNTTGQKITQDGGQE